MYTLTHLGGKEGISAFHFAASGKNISNRIFFSYTPHFHLNFSYFLPKFSSGKTRCGRKQRKTRYFIVEIVKNLSLFLIISCANYVVVLPAFIVMLIFLCMKPV